MSLASFILRRTVRGIAKSMRRHYNQGLTLHPELSMPALCQDVVGSRYQSIRATQGETARIQKGLRDVADIYDATVLVALAESKIPDHDTELHHVLVTETIYEVAKMEGIEKPDDDSDVLEKLSHWLCHYGHIVRE